MHAFRSRLVSQRRFAWLLWLALLVPVAQAATNRHAVSHLGGETSRSDDGRKGQHPAHCDLCLIAAAIGGAAPAGELQPVVPPALGYVLPQAAIADVWQALLLRAYRSRAPPLASR